MIAEHEYVSAKTQLAEANIAINEARTLLKALDAEATGGTRLIIRAPMSGGCRK